MRIRNQWLAAGVVIVALSGCASRYELNPPPGWLPDMYVRAKGRDVYGAWCALHFDTGQLRKIEGELIAVGADSVWVLSPDGLVAAPTEHVVSGSFATYADLSESTTQLSGSRWPEMATFARFPQGLPAGVDPRGLTPKH
jgi:hypothetical protein